MPVEAAQKLLSPSMWQLLWFLSLSGLVPRGECLHTPLTLPCFFCFLSALQTKRIGCV